MNADDANFFLSTLVALSYEFEGQRVRNLVMRESGGDWTYWLPDALACQGKWVQAWRV